MNTISYSIFGSNNWYFQFLPSLIRAHFCLFPNFAISFYHDANLDNMYYGRVLKNLQQVSLINLTQVNKDIYKTHSMLWRMMPIFENKYSYVFCRDVDSLPTGRERISIEEFLQSGCIVHSINDHLNHVQVLLGGMCGFKTIEFLQLIEAKDLNDPILSWDNFINEGNYRLEDWQHHGCDQEFLAKRIWNYVEQHCFFHRLQGKRHDIKPKIYREDLKINSIVGLNSEMLIDSNKLVPHIGVQGYNKREAIDFYDQYINREIRSNIMDVEKANAVDKYRSF